LLFTLIYPELQTHYCPIRFEFGEHYVYGFVEAGWQSELIFVYPGKHTHP
jgi:hypothetical protein